MKKYLKIIAELLLFTISFGVLAGSFSGAPYVPGSATITGGTINNTTIGASTPAAGTFTTLTSSAVAFTGGTASGVAITSGTASGVAITGGTASGVAITGGTITNSSFTGGISGVAITGGTASGVAITNSKIGTLYAQINPNGVSSVSLGAVFSGATSIEVVVDGTAYTNSNAYGLRLATAASGVIATGYTSACHRPGAAPVAFTTGFVMEGEPQGNTATDGIMFLLLADAATNTWIYTSSFNRVSTIMSTSIGKIVLGAGNPLTSITLSVVSGSSGTFNAGKVSMRVQ